MASSLLIKVTHTSCMCLQFDQKWQYLWRLSRAYADAHDFAMDLAEKKSYAENGKHIIHDYELIRMHVYTVDI